jgi:2,5-diketo-D-gluconate reductase A
VGIAKAIAASGVPRSELFITDKVSPNGFFGMPCRTHDECLAALKERLAMLDTDYVDLYLLHHPFAKDERVNQWRALVEAQKQGLVKHIGVSNWSERHIEEIKAADTALPYPEVNQMELHPLCTQAEALPYMQSKGIAIIAYSSLAPASTWRVDPGQDSAPIEDDSHRAVLTAMVARYNANGGDKAPVSEAQLLLRWALQRGFAILPKSSKAERIRANAQLFHFELSPEDMVILDGLDRNLAVAWPFANPMNAE